LQSGATDVPGVQLHNLVITYILMYSAETWLILVEIPHNFFGGWGCGLTAGNVYESAEHKENIYG
jgi:hypothetical protein